MGHGMTIHDWSRTGATLEQRRCFAPVPPKGVRLEHAHCTEADDWRRTGATARPHAAPPQRNFAPIVAEEYRLREGA